MGGLIGSRRGRPLLPLWAQWPLFALSIVWCVFQLARWLRGDPDAYPREHSRQVVLSLGLVLLASSGLVRRRRGLHVALFAGGAACVVLAAVLRYVPGR